MKGINKLASVVTKVLEVFHWVGVGLMAAATVCSAVAPGYIGYFVSLDTKECCGAVLDVYGFEIHAAVTNGTVDMTTFLLFGIGATVILLLMALVFRNLSRIFKASEDDTPFRKENIRMLREIGYFSIAVPVVGLIMSIVVRLVIGAEAAEISVGQGGIFMGIIVLCLTQYFVYGAELEKDVDGLL